MNAGVVRRFAAELEGAVHVKEQEAIIAEVANSCSEGCSTKRDNARGSSDSPNSHAPTCGPDDSLRQQCEESCRAVLKILDNNCLSVDAQHVSGTVLPRTPHRLVALKALTRLLSL
jgi:hypothetical protein